MHKVITLPEGSGGVRILMAFICACIAMHLKEQSYLHPDGDLKVLPIYPLPLSLQSGRDM